MDPQAQDEKSLVEDPGRPFLPYTDDEIDPRRRQSCASPVTVISNVRTSVTADFLMCRSREQSLMRRQSDVDPGCHVRDVAVLGDPSKLPVSPPASHTRRVMGPFHTMEAEAPEFEDVCLSPLERTMVGVAAPPAHPIPPPRHMDRIATVSPSVSAQGHCTSSPSYPAVSHRTTPTAAVGRGVAVLKEGWLFKQSKHVIKRQQRRWCVLEHGSLTYKEETESTEIKGTIELDGAHLGTPAGSAPRHAFSITPRKGAFENRRFVFSCDTKEDRDAWHAAIECAIERRKPHLDTEPMHWFDRLLIGVP